MKRNRDDQGAVAILVAAGAVAILVLAALVVELGLARDTRRQAQASADAAALAAASAIWESGAPDLAAGVAAAKEYARFNFDTEDSAWASCQDPLLAPGQAFADFEASPATSCISFRSDDAIGGPVEVRVVIPTRPVDTPLGSLAGVSQVDVGAMAHAGVEPPTIVAEGGMRPWPICSAVINTTGEVTFVPLKRGSVSTKSQVPGATACSTEEGPSGGWWVAQCTDQSNANGATETSVQDGCPTDGYKAVGGQTTADPAALSAYLRSKCPNKTQNDTCLQSDTGSNFHNASDEWQALVGKTITMPVLCFKPTCNPNAWDGNGQNASYAIYRMADVEVCGFKFKNKSASTDWPTSGPCALNNPHGVTSSHISGDGGMFLVIKRIYGGPSGSDWQIQEPPGEVRLTR